MLDTRLCRGEGALDVEAQTCPPVLGVDSDLWHLGRFRRPHASGLDGERRAHQQRNQEEGGPGHRGMIALPSMAGDLSDLPPLVRWRLVLGESGEHGLGSPQMGADALAADAALQWLYGRDEGLAERDIADRQGGLGPSSLSVPDWINEVHRLFPQETIERLEQDAVERYQIHEVVTNPEVLARVEPNPVLLKAVLQTKHLMNPAVLELARQLVAKVVKQLMEQLAKEVRQVFSGSIDRRRHTPLKYSRNFDAKRTIRSNLGNVDAETGRLFIKRPFFWSRTRKHSARWQVILLVDQSGSMLDSTIHAAVTAACLWGLPAVKTHLVVFDTEVVDLTRDVTDPVEVLMKVQLGGGTDIGKAVAYAQQLIENPRRTIVACVSDFYEGGDPHRLVHTVRAMCEQGTHFLGLAALDSKANPCYDRGMGSQLAGVGAHVGAMTPGQLAEFIAEKVKG